MCHYLITVEFDDGQLATTQYWSPSDVKTKLAEVVRFDGRRRHRALRSVRSLKCLTAHPHPKVARSLRAAAACPSGLPLFDGLIVQPLRRKTP